MNKSCFMVQCIIPNDNNIINNLSEALNESIQERWPRATISLRSCMDYWKFEGTKKIIFNLAHHQIINVNTFIKAFPLHWNYSDYPAHNADTGRKYHSEKAIWNKNCHPEEIFLTPHVEWVHIYTWPDWFDELLIA